MELMVYNVVEYELYQKVNNPRCTNHAFYNSVRSVFEMQLWKYASRNTFTICIIKIVANSAKYELSNHCSATFSYCHNVCVCRLSVVVCDTSALLQNN